MICHIKNDCPDVMWTARSILIVSLGVNLLLAAWLVARLGARPPAAPGSIVMEQAPEGAPVKSSPRLRRTNIVEFSTNTVDAPGFRWAEIETNDFRAYAANLRAVGCPEKTLRHILLPDVEKAYRERKHALKNEPAPFWQNAIQVGARERSRRRAELELQQEEADLVRELLGVTWTGKAYKLWVEEEEAAFTLGFLAEEKVLPVLGVLEHIESLGDTIRQEMRGLKSEQDFEHIRAVAQLLQRQTTSYLTPSEAQELLLRGFDALQDELFDRQRNRGVEMTGFEYRELLRMASQGRDWVGDVLVEALGNEADDFDRIRRERPPQFETEAVALLGPQRFAEYERSQDKDFHEAIEAAERGNRPESVAIQAYDIHQTALAGVRQLMAEASLTLEERAAALDRVHLATVEALTALYGPKEGPAYAKIIQRAVVELSRKERPRRREGWFGCRWR